MTSNPVRLPSALEHLDTIRQQAAHKGLVIFLDYDGTLTPIVPRPEDAKLSETMHAVLKDLADTWTVAIVSGRDLDVVRTLVDLDTIYYAGSHGFEIAGPNGMRDMYSPAHAFLADLDAAEKTLREQLETIDGAQVERKHFAIAVHYRRVSTADVTTIEAHINTVKQTHPALRRTGGKKVFELRPDLEWNKGTALFWLLDVMGLERDKVLPVYIGDDVTDEDAFTALQQEGVGILVTDEPRQTAAQYQVTDTEVVRTLLETLITLRQEG